MPPEFESSREVILPATPEQVWEAVATTEGNVRGCSQTQRDGSEWSRHHGFHMFNSDIVSMPDKWEYPWYAAWDLAFHCVPLAIVDPDFAKARSI